MGEGCRKDTPSRLPQKLTGAMTKHEHVCVCEKRWSCIINILPLSGIGRVRCEKWIDSICDECLNGILAAQGKEALRELGNVADALTALRVSRRLKEMESIAVT
jgi:hypothetical protein